MFLSLSHQRLRGMANDANIWFMIGALSQKVEIFAYSIGTKNVKKIDFECT
jgi:hypothetical protein